MIIMLWVKMGMNCYPIEADENKLTDNNYE